MDNKTYDILKWIAQYLLPGSSTLYFALGAIWPLPYVEQIVGTIMAVDVFLGAMLGISNMQYERAKLLEGSGELVTNTGSDYNTFLAEEPKSIFNLSSEAYERIKWGVLIALPAGGTLYLALSQLWGFPYGEQIVGTIAAVTAFLGLVLGVSTSRYNSSKS